MPSKNMLPKGKRRQSVKQEYRAARTVAQEREAALREAGKDVESLTPHVSPFAGAAGAGDEWAEWRQASAGGGGTCRCGGMGVPRLYVEPEVEREITVLDDLEAEDGVA